MDKSKPLFNQFKKINKEEWAQKATSDLKGENVFEKYQWFKGSLSILPYYDQSDLNQIINIELFANRLHKNSDPSGDPRVWANMQRVFVKDSKNANNIALDGLNNGADGIIFDFAPKGSFVVKELLQNIKPQYCYIAFENIGQNDALEILNHLSSKFSNLDIQGHLLIEEIESNDILAFVEKHVTLGAFRCINITSKESLPIEQIGKTLTQINRQIRSLLLHGFDIISIAKSILITIEIGNDFFLEIAKVRVLRNLTFQIFRAYGHEDFNPEDITIRCISTHWTDAKYQPHANLLKSSTAALSSILGGCDLLEIEPEFPDNPQSVRVARNVSNILKEESFLSKTADPVAGTYYLESLTDKLAMESWKIFQESLESINTEE